MLSREENNNKTPTQQQKVTLFTPRQVILSNSTMKQQKQQPTSEQRVLLYHSISQFLEFNGFLKSLSKFRKETLLEKDSWKSCSLNLEEIFQEHLQKRSDNKANVPNAKQKDGSNDNRYVETVKGTKENEADNGKKSNTELENNAVSGDDVKSMKKKKKKETKDVDSSKHLNGETNVKENNHPVEDVKKSKDKKKKHKDESEPLEKKSPEKKEENAVPQKDKSKSKKSKEETLVEKDEADKEKKSSKKRKKSSSVENGTDHVEETQTDDSKRRKTNDAEHAPKTPKGSGDEVLENGSENKSEKLNKTKEQNDSTQPKSANAFRRVKADEVEFADERLQDNSYWAKDGADSGYGAKAQEVLGQVRGRDFRHEKTKKKRGSYRGGQIDLHSHSIKFNYDDDDE